MTSTPVIELITELLVSKMFAAFFTLLCLHYKIGFFFSVIQQIPLKNFVLTS